ncbi:hypothetical protein [Thermus altitudinis]|uniref:hypothetical protein n=1 Tax=Thermus altitudinis TaxID=2908145 RepID=UPI001FAA5B02|nr:hypothetical protein [Thermus altitudinis]
MLASYRFLAQVAFFLFFSHAGLGYIALYSGMHVPFAVIFSALAAVMLISRMAFFLLRMMPLSRWSAAVYFVLGVISFRILAAVAFGELNGIDSDYLASTLVQVLVYPWLLALTAEALVYKASYEGLPWRVVYGVAFVLVGALVLGVYVGLTQFGRLYFVFSPDLYGETFVNYHFLGDGLALTVLLLLYKWRSTLTAAPLAILGGLVTLLSYSRTSFFSYVLALPLLFQWNARSVLLSWGLTLVALTAVFPFISEAVFSEEVELTFLDRVLTLLGGDGKGDESLATRVELLTEVPTLIGILGIWGKPMYEVELYGPGMYVHNLLSYWFEYGIGPFFLILFLLGSALACAIGGYARREPLTLALVMFTLVSLFFARSHIWPYVWFVLMFGCGSVGGRKQ